MTFPDILTSIVSSSQLLYSSPTPPQLVQTPRTPPTHLQVTAPCSPPFYCSSLLAKAPQYFIILMLSAIALDYVLTLKDLELGTVDGREHVAFVFLGLVSHL